MVSSRDVLKDINEGTTCFMMMMQENRISTGEKLLIYRWYKSTPTCFHTRGSVRIATKSGG